MPWADGLKHVSASPDVWVRRVLSSCFSPREKPICFSSAVENVTRKSLLPDSFTDEPAKKCQRLTYCLLFFVVQRDTCGLSEYCQPVQT